MNKLLLCVLALGMSSMTFAGNENVFDPPVMGWSSWNTYRVNINEALIKKQADAMVQKGLKDAGYNYVRIRPTGYNNGNKDLTLGWIYNK